MQTFAGVGPGHQPPSRGQVSGRGSAGFALRGSNPRFAQIVIIEGTREEKSRGYAGSSRYRYYICGEAQLELNICTSRVVANSLSLRVSRLQLQ
eukprot:scaffold78309_cov35-Prasinocladus_malaysianus.AAC.2